MKESATVGERSIQTHTRILHIYTSTDLTHSAECLIFNDKYGTIFLVIYVSLSPCSLIYWRDRKRATEYEYRKLYNQDNTHFKHVHHEPLEITPLIYIYCIEALGLYMFKPSSRSFFYVFLNIFDRICSYCAINSICQ